MEKQTKIYYAYFHDRDGVIVCEFPVKETGKSYTVIHDGPVPFKTIRKSDIGKIVKECIHGYGLTPEQAVDALKKSAIAVADDLSLRLAYYQQIVTGAEKFMVGKYRNIAAEAEKYGADSRFPRP